MSSCVRQIKQNCSANHKVHPLAHKAALLDMLLDILKSEKYALALSPGFYQFYALSGALHALEETECLHPTHIR